MVSLSSYAMPHTDTDAGVAEIEIPVDDLLSSASPVDARPTTKTGLRLAITKVHKVQAEDMTATPRAGPSSLRASVLNRTAARKSVASSLSMARTSPVLAGSAGPAARQRLSSTGSTVVRSRSPSAARQAAASSGATPSSPPPLPPAPEVLPKRKATSSSASEVTALARPKSQTSTRSTISTAVRAVSSPSLPAASDLKGKQPQIASKATPAAQQGALGPTAPRPASVSIPRSARTRVASTPGSIASVRSKTASSSDISKGKQPESMSSMGSRVRTASSSSVLSTTSTARGSKRTPVKTSSSPIVPERAASVASVRSTKLAAPSKQPGDKKTSVSRSSGTAISSESHEAAPSATVPPVPALPDSQAVPSPKTAGKPVTSLFPGSRLKQGIPCVVTLRQIKFRATVRYLGEVKFDQGSFVGVEVPMTAETSGLKLDWNDGSVADVQVISLVPQVRLHTEQHCSTLF